MPAMRTCTVSDNHGEAYVKILSEKSHKNEIKPASPVAHRINRCYFTPSWSPIFQIS
jgi:hypothetical protein